MKQIYYTQCPIGYGLGASNGFQIKRLTPDYPISSDFRHLGMRAFLAGTRHAAPPALRFRRNELGEAEVAWLTPRSHEYETERGFWGRPGGHFAHGVVLDVAELDALQNWPAGLFDRPFWARSDRVPSRGEPPTPIELGAGDLRTAPVFESFDDLAAQEDDPYRLGVLLTITAAVVRTERTLYLLDAPERLPDRIGLLTLAFPAPWRPALTFSTYHDRPEELPGFRLQGTIPAARPNRAALLANGFVADFGSGLIEPGIEPAPWAATLAVWLTRRSSADRLAWERTAQRGRIAWPLAADDAPWTDDWLNLLFALESRLPTPEPSPLAPAVWTELSRLAVWARRHGLAAELVEARPPAWWSKTADDSSEGRAALLEHLRLPGAWRREDDPAAWGRSLAPWWRRAQVEARQPLVESALELAPAPARPRLVRALIEGLPEPEAQTALDGLSTLSTSDRPLLLPLGVRGAAAEALDRRDPRRLRRLIGEAFATPDALSAVLDALAAEAANRPDAFQALADWLAQGLETAGPGLQARVVRWALQQGENAGTWLQRFLRRRFAEPSNHETWRSIHQATAPPLRARFASVVLEIAGDPSLPDDAFRWGVEEVLLPLPDAERPHQPRWAGEYLDHTPSGLDLLKRLTAKEYRRLGLPRWLEQAQARGELSERQWQRILDCLQYARGLQTGDARSLANLRLPAVPAEERGSLIKQMLRHVGQGSNALGLVLDACRDAWPRGFDAGQPGLEGVAQALAEWTVIGQPDPAAWLDRVVALLNRLDLTGDETGGFEADGLAAEICAAVLRRSDLSFSVWSARAFLLQHDAAWRLLTADVRRDLAGESIRVRLERLATWDGRLTKGMRSDRFFEIWLNACDGPTLAASVADRAEELRTLGPIPWWRATADPDARNDLRDAFARLAPMAPLPVERLTAVQNWMRPSQPRANVPSNDDALPVEPGTAEADVDSAPFLSRRGAARWRCLDALSGLGRPGLDSAACWRIQAEWRARLPLAALDATDRYRFLGGFIRRVDGYDSVQIARLAKWIFDCGVTDADRLSRWADELEELEPVSDAIRIARSAMVGDLRVELRNVIRDARSPIRKSQSPDSPHDP